LGIHCRRKKETEYVYQQSHHSANGPCLFWPAYGSLPAFLQSLVVGKLIFREGRTKFMGTQDPNRFSWQGVYSWIEPVVGSRREWKSDRWRFLKIGACLIPVFFVCAWVYGSITRQFVECMVGVAVFTYTYFWVFTFFPRRIALYEDRISIFRGGSRGTSASIKIYYSDIKHIKVAPETNFFLITLTLSSGKDMALYSPDSKGVDSLNGQLKEFRPSLK
jgi:hypothetical protein